MPGRMMAGWHWESWRDCGQVEEAHLVVLLMPMWIGMGKVTRPVSESGGAVV